LPHPYGTYGPSIFVLIVLQVARITGRYRSLHLRSETSRLTTNGRKKLVPTGIATALDIGLSNLSLKTITLSFYSALWLPSRAEKDADVTAAMVKSSSLIFVLTFAFLFRLETFSLRLVGVIFLIFSGVLLMVASETAFMLGGFLLVLFASAAGGLRWALTQVLLKNKGIGLDNPAATLFWLAPVMGMSLLCVSVIMDDWIGVLHTKFFDGLSASLTTTFFLLAPGILAFCMVLSEF
jgi:solute carrier family 35 protein C2